MSFLLHRNSRSSSVPRPSVPPGSDGGAPDPTHAKESLIDPHVHSDDETTTLGAADELQPAALGADAANPEDHDLERFFSSLQRIVGDDEAASVDDITGDDTHPSSAEFTASSASWGPAVVTPDDNDATASDWATGPRTLTPVAREDDDREDEVPRLPAVPHVETTTRPEPRVAELEAERDKWRERAVIWRERAMAADVVAKELRAHMADLQANLEDVRVVIRTLAEQNTAAAPQTVSVEPAKRGLLARMLDPKR